MNEKIKINWHYILGVIGMLIPIGLATYNFETYYGVMDAAWHSVQYDVIVLVTVITIVFLVARTLDRPEISKMELGTAKIYFSTTVTVGLASFAAFGIAFSILWGNLYTFAIEKGLGNYIDNLRGQGLVLLLLVAIASAAVVLTFLLPLIRQINKKERG